MFCFVLSFDVGGEVEKERGLAPVVVCFVPKERKKEATAFNNYSYLENGQRERPCLAAPGLCEADDVLACFRGV